MKLLPTVASGLAGALLLVSCTADQESGLASVPPRVEVPVRAIFAELDRAAVRLSPDGEQIAFLAPFKGVTSVWLAQANDLEGARAVTRDLEQPVESLWWAYSGRHILFRQTLDGGTKGRLSVLSTGGGEIKTLTPAGREAELVHLSPSSPGTAVVAVAGSVPGTRDLFSVDIESGERELLAQDEPFEAWGVDDDLDLRLAFEPTTDGGLRVRKKAETGEWAEFSWVPTLHAAQTRFLGFDAGSLEAYFVDSRGRETAALVASNMTTGEARVLFQDPTADVVDVLMHPVARTVQAVAAAREERRWRVLDEDVRSDLKTLEELADGDLEILDRSLDDAVWLAAIVPFEAPRRFYRYDRSRQDVELLFVGRPGDGTAGSQLAAVASAQ